MDVIVNAAPSVSRLIEERLKRFPHGLRSIQILTITALVTLSLQH